jgi:hypothetical protein
MPKLELTDNPNKQLVGAFISRISNEEADSILCEFTSYHMRQKLEKKRNDGKHGWFNSTCTNVNLMEMLKEHLNRGDMIDVINLAAMIEARKQIWGESA